MPIYVFQCNRCDVRTEAFVRSMAATSSAKVVCEACGSEDLARVYTPFAIYRSELTKIEQLDPKYFKKVDQALANTADADAMRHLERMVPFDAAADPGDPIKF